MGTSSKLQVEYRKDKSSNYRNDEEGTGGRVHKNTKTTLRAREIRKGTDSRASLHNKYNVKQEKLRSIARFTSHSMAAKRSVPALIGSALP